MFQELEFLENTDHTNYFRCLSIPKCDHNAHPSHADLPSRSLHQSDRQPGAAIVHVHHAG